MAGRVAGGTRVFLAACLLQILSAASSLWKWKWANGGRYPPCQVCCLTTGSFADLARADVETAAESAGDEDVEYFVSFLPCQDGEKEDFLR